VAAKEWGLVSLGWVEERRSGVEWRRQARGWRADGNEKVVVNVEGKTRGGRRGGTGEGEEAKGKPGSPTWWNENDDDDWVVVVVGASATALW
jgi:hypothetical protein